MVASLVVWFKLGFSGNETLGNHTLPRLALLHVFIHSYNGAGSPRKHPEISPGSPCICPCPHRIKWSCNFLLMTITLAKLVILLRICWLLDTRSPKYLVHTSRQQFSETLPVFSVKYVPFRDQPPEPRIPGKENTKSPVGQWEWREAGISLSLPLCFQAHIFFLFGARYHIKHSNLMCILYPEKCPHILEEYWFQNGTSLVPLEVCSRTLWSCFLLDDVAHHIIIVGNPPMPTSSLWFGALAGCYVVWISIPANLAFISLQIGDWLGLSGQKKANNTWLDVYYSENTLDPLRMEGIQHSWLNNNSQLISLKHSTV